MNMRQAAFSLQLLKVVNCVFLPWSNHDRIITNLGREQQGPLPRQEQLIAQLIGTVFRLRKGERFH